MNKQLLLKEERKMKRKESGVYLRHYVIYIFEIDKQNKM